MTSGVPRISEPGRGHSVENLSGAPPLVGAEQTLETFAPKCPQKTENCHFRSVLSITRNIVTPSINDNSRLVSSLTWTESTVSCASMRNMHLQNIL